MRPIIVLSSGGKDSLLMLERLRADPQWEVAALVTTVNEIDGRVAMHGISLELLQAQADSLGLPLTVIKLPESCDNETYEQRLTDGLRDFRERGVTHVGCGDLFLTDIREYRERLFGRLGWQPIFPLWFEPTDRLAGELIGQGWQLTVTCVDTHKLPRSFLGAEFNQSLLDELPAGVDPCGENGEFHTFVHGGPGFATALAFETGRTVMSHDRFAMLELFSPVGRRE